MLEDMRLGILIKAGRLVRPGKTDQPLADIYIEGGRISRIAAGMVPAAGDQVIHAQGKMVLPGLVDLHVHMRDPGQTHKEDLATGLMAAAAGGVTTVVAMPNTTPVVDCPEIAADIMERAKKEGKARLYQAGAMTMREEGKELADIEGMARAGVRVLSEDGKSVMNAALCRDAFRLAASLKLPIFDHCEDLTLRGNGCMNDDENAVRLGLPGISNSVEDTITARDILLALETGARLHLCHVSTRGVVSMLRYLQSLGITQITAEACPHHFILSSDDIPGDDPDYKMNPPLRSAKDTEAIRQGIIDGVISVISTDHAPHAPREKSGSMRDAAFGIIGLETSLALSYTTLVETGSLTINQLAERMSFRPAQILGIEERDLREGCPADVIVVDFSEEYQIDRGSFFSKARNTPFHGRKVKGKVHYTICGGKIVYEAGR